ncbi:MAG: indolepyruvate oxidoreductase subunit beta [Bacteroidales bacterium]|nr:indolepyruvate oxidoreductase subunit beta [Bacteroidales bacterium]
MKKDIILSGVGGQGILSIATVIGEAATAAGLFLKQAEVHGMSQRGGDVQSNLRLSTEVIYSDLIPVGSADLIISMEPMEALRYLPYLSREGSVVTSSKPLVNIPDYPSQEALLSELDSLPDVVRLDIEEAARTCGNPKGANMVLLGMAAPAIGILDAGELREAIARVFARKGEAIVAANQKAFDLGLEAAKNRP